LRQRSRGFQQSVFNVGGIAERPRSFRSAGDCGDRLARCIERYGSERAALRIFQIGRHRRQVARQRRPRLRLATLASIRVIARVLFSAVAKIPQHAFADA